MSQYGPSRPRPIQDRVSIAIVASLYNNQFVQGLIDAGREELEELAPNATITVYRVPGAFEIPVCAELVIKNTKPDAVIAFGVIIRGSTEHADLVGASVTDALQQMAVRHTLPVVHEVLLVSSEEQAEERCLGVKINRGTEAAQVAVNMIALFRKMRASFAGQPELETV
ncbi:6,7-dimethyl-8-ribityllumazine synthase [Prosthecobacter dejongeii]|uniref:6,7-dimethyl-8-ribityllumazine synthase n=1 Tax=Prosthecobacter dejongeii TaxID=48465 RepID=A0A7W7YNH9_9BACT|nr:6,7-dimethyl-8-ribityllumazine synthase [Prosthecobacter dejongeii]MBB5039195.1 6,7-dimethyl-8-ribityllumazine synthase [Prosthecobacter dejongeii]